MKRVLKFLLCTVFLLLSCVTAASAYPLGPTQDDISVKVDQEGFIDYRFYNSPLGNRDLKPLADFSVTADGTETVISPYDTTLNIETPTLTATQNQKLTINNLSKSTAGTNRVMNNYDFQYRIVPEGQEAYRYDIPIVAGFYSTWPQGKHNLMWRQIKLKPPTKIVI